MKSRYNPVLVAIIAIGLVVSLWLNYQRYEIEQRNDTVEMAMEYEGLEHLANWEGFALDDVLAKFKKAGITSLVVFDTSLEKLNNNGSIVAVTGEELLKGAALGGDGGKFAPVLAEGIVVPNAVYVTVGTSYDVLTEVVEDLYLRYGKERLRIVNNEPQIIEIVGNPMVITEENYDTKPGVMQAPLGLSTEEMRKAKAFGFNVIVRPMNYLPNDYDQIRSIFRRIDKSGANVTGYIGCGREVVGYPDYIAYMAHKLKKQNMTFGMVEHYTQLQFASMDGNFSLAEHMDYRVARTYIIDKAEQRKIKMPEALRRWALTDEERNIRINYIKPFMIPQEGQDILALNLDYVSKIAASVQGRGYKLGPAGVFTQNTADGKFVAYFPDRIWFVPLAFAIFAGGIMYLSLLVNISKKAQYILLLAGGAVASITLMKFGGVLTRQLLALLAATVFPVLSMTVIVELWHTCKKTLQSTLAIIVNATWQLALAVVLSLIGASFVAAILGDSRFFLEINIYRGVKLTFILPVLLISLWYMQRFNVLSKGQVGNLAIHLRNFFSTAITVKHIVFLGALAFVAYIFVGRSGHTAGVPVPALEIKMRLFLEQVMYARPREKEFMIGHPAFYLAAYAAYKQAPRLWQMLLVVGATIGQGSLVQTFAHMRTPVMMSFIRAVDGYLLGVVLGIGAIIVVSILMPYVQKWQRRFLEHE